MYDLNTLERIGEGRLSTVYRLDGGRVLKVFKYPNIADYEFRQTSAVCNAGVSRQRPHGMTVAGGMEAIVYDYLEGELLMHAIDKNRMRVLRCIRRMADCHTSILMGVCPDLPSAREGFRYAIEHAPKITDTQRAHLLEGLEAMPDGNNVLHGDLHPMNVLINGKELFAIDWMTGSRGDPAADVARSWLILRHSPIKEDRNHAEYLLRSALQSMLAGAYLHRVCRAADIKKEAVKQWLPFIAAARLTEDRPMAEVRAILRIVGRYCEKKK